MKIARTLNVISAVFATGAFPLEALAQNTTGNAVTDAADAFGTNVGIETSGIYTEFDTRGLSPSRAGNIRIDGIYFDPVVSPAGRLRERTAIRVGFATEEYPFNAPTGIVDHKFRAFPNTAGASFALHVGSYDAWIGEFDLRLPLVKDHIGLTGGIAYTNQTPTDGSGSRGYSYTIRPIIKYDGIEIAPFASVGGYTNVRSRPLLIATGNNLPDFPAVARYFGQSWALGQSETGNYGVTIKAPITDSVSIRGGAFYSDFKRIRNFSELYNLQPGGLVGHLLIADPEQGVNSFSGELQVAWRFTTGKLQHRLIAGYRHRNRLTETGGSVRVISPNLVRYGVTDLIAERPFNFGPVNSGRVEQDSFMLGYTGKVEGLGTLNAGLQKASYRGSSRDGLTGATTASRNQPWLYNMTLRFDLAPNFSAYLGAQKGLEDSGTAPDSAINRNEQLPSTLSHQYEAGIRWKFSGGQWVINVFDISKPYFSFDAVGNFTQIGTLRHRGIETSVSGRIGDRFNIVAGALIMKPRVSIGGRPAGTPSLYIRADASYRTNLLGGLTPTASFSYTGSRLVNPSLDVPGFATVDLGVRQPFKIGKVRMSLRAIVQNVFDAASWKVVAANALFPDERRRVLVSLGVDF